jgi:hypothetical protein
VEKETDDNKENEEVERQKEESCGEEDADAKTNEEIEEE